MMRTARVFLATLMMGVLMLAIASASVNAGGGSPTLSADHNPVIVPLGQTTGKVTLTWDTGKGGTVEFYDSLNGGPEIGPFVQPASGTDTDTLQLGETVVYRMYTTGKGQLLNTLTVTAEHPGANPPPQPVDCALYPCIANVAVTQSYQDGEFSLDINWTTSEAAGAIVAVSRQPAISDTDGNEFAHVDGATFQIERTGPKHTAHIAGLGFHTYYYAIEAIDAGGHSTKHYGSYAITGSI